MANQLQKKAKNCPGRLSLLVARRHFTRQDLQNVVDKPNGGELAGIEHELAKLERQPVFPNNKRLRDVLLKKRAAGLEQKEQTKRIEERKNIKDKWRGESKAWRTNTKDMLRGVESETFLGPKKEVLEALNDLDETMIEEEDYNKKKVLS
jgi:hypothetical protein